MAVDGAAGLAGRGDGDGDGQRLGTSRARIRPLPGVRWAHLGGQPVRRGVRRIGHKTTAAAALGAATCTKFRLWILRSSRRTSQPG